MKTWSSTAVVLILLAAVGCGGGSDSKTINGAGATFPAPIYSRWAHAFGEQSGVQINYQPVGSGGGISHIKNRTMAFGASDLPLDKKELDESGLIQFPLVIGGVVPVVNLSGVAPGQLKLTPDALAGLFLGNIKRWDDPAIKEINPDLKLPEKEVVVVHRADGSGTSWMFTTYLTDTSEAWKSKVGAGNMVEWPAGMGGKGNDGVASYVQRLDGAIGYVEFAYALQNKMSYVTLRNRAGKFVEPTLETFQAAAASANWKNAPGFYLVLVNQPGDASWPITGASFILLHKDQPDRERAAALLKFFDWCYRHGGAAAEELHYVPIPGSVVDLVEAKWQEQLSSAGKPIER